MDDTRINHNLNYKINSLRVKMVSVGILKGFTHPETIKYSVELDKLIIQVQHQNN